MSQETASIEFTERIEKLHELAFSILEEKKAGAIDVPIEDYEKLLDYTIEFVQEIRDAVDEYGGTRVCGNKIE